MSTRFRHTIISLFLLGFLNFTLAWASPHISSISPSVGPVNPVGSPVTINGSGFGASASGNTITVGGVSTTPTSWSDTRIVAPVPAVLLPGFADVIVTSGGTASNSASFLVIPVITNDSPAQGPVGTSVVVTGTSFGDTQGASTVTFNGVTASPTSWSNTSITVPVPLGAITGSIVVTVNGFSTNGRPFPVVPNITAIGPTAGQIGSSVTISGITFGQTQGFGGVTFNGVSASVQSWSDSSIAVLVPSGATSGNVVVTDHQLLASNGVNFNVITPPVPAISLISPDAGRAGIGVTISGSNFGATQSSGTVTFNGLPATINSWGDNSISTSAPAGVHSGPVIVTTVGGASNSVQFTFAPGIRFQTQPLYITPDEINLESGASGSFKLVDASGHPVTDATWSVDLTDLATIAADDPTLPTATLQALAAGEVTITATSSLGTAQAKATIYGEGLTPEGTSLWGFYPETQDNFFDFKAKSRRNTQTDPFLYLPEDTFDFSHLSALDENGRLAWKTTLNPLDPGNTFNFLVGAAGTNDGGVLAMALEAGGPNDPSTAMYRYAPDGTPLWNHKFATSGTSLPAIAPDGTVFVLTDTTNLIALKDTDGTEKFRFTPVGGSKSFTSSEQPGSINPDGFPVSPTNPWKPCADFFVARQFNPPDPGSGSSVSFEPLIGTDGSAYLMSTVENFSFNYDHCTISQTGTDSVTNDPIYVITSMSGQLQYNKSVQLLRVNSGGSAATQVGSVSYSGQAGFGSDPHAPTTWSFNSGASQLPSIAFNEMVPDANGGMLMSWTQQSSTAGASPQTSLTKVLNDAPVATFSITTAGQMATNDQGTVFFYQKGNFSPVGDSVVAFDILNGVPKWTIAGTLLFATDDGGALIQTGFFVVHANANGVLDPDALPVGGTASYMAIGLFQVNGLAGSVTAVPTNSNILSQLIAGPWPVPKLGTPATAKQPINVSLREFHQSGLLLNGDPESSGCTGFDPGNPKVDLAALMAPVQTTETFTDANGNPITSQTPASNVVSMKNNSPHTLTLVPHTPPFNNVDDPTIRVTVSPQTLPADGQYHDITFTGVADSLDRPVRIEAFDNITAENRGDILQVDVKSWHRWFIDYYAVSELNGSLQPTPPLQQTLQDQFDRIFRSQANLGFTFTNKGTVADHYDVSPHDGNLRVSFKGGQVCMLGWVALGASDPGCTNDTELTPMYQRLVTAQQQAAGQNPIDLDNPDMFYLLFFKQFDVNTIGGWSSTNLNLRRLPSVVHTDYQDFPATLLNQDKFVAVATAHEIAHKLGQGDHVTNTKDVPGTQDANAVYLMFTPLSINRDTVSKRGDDKRYPCRLRRQDWNNVNYVYPTPR